MGRVTLTLPRLGETMEEARVTDWLVSPGASFARGDVLLEVETDKTVVEVPALEGGTLIAQLVATGETIALDQPIAEVEVKGTGTAPANPAAPGLPDTAPQDQNTTSSTLPAAQGASPPPHGEGMEVGGALKEGRVAASPAARAAARRAGVDLSLVEGTGRRGRVQASDLKGGAATMLLLHGLFDSPKGWRDLPGRLRAAGHAVAMPDLPGHGSTPPVADFDAAVEELAASLPPGPLHLVGHSLGAALAVRLALRLGARVRRLVLSAPAGIGPRISADFIDGMLAAETPAALARALALLDAGPVSAQALAAELARLRAERAGHAALAQAVATGGFQQIDMAGDLARVTCPITVLFGTADRILDWRDVANLPPAAAIHLIRGAGHLPHLAVPDLFLALVTGDTVLAGRVVHA